MKKSIIISAFLISGFNIMAQGDLEPDQNPNYQKSMDQYIHSAAEYVAYQGTTKQETYKAIDPLEEKRELKSLRKQYRASRPLRRHERNMARIENTRYFGGSNFNGFRDNGYNRFNNNYGGVGLGVNSLLGLGVLGYLLFD